MPSTFIPSGKREVRPAGSPKAKICIIGEAPGADEDRLGTPFVGMAGSILEACMQSAMIARSECYITNLLKYRPDGNDIEPFFKKKDRVFTTRGWDAVLALREELNSVDSNIIIPLGNPAMSAMVYETAAPPKGKRWSITSHRGYIAETWSKRKMLPTYHPAGALGGRQFNIRYIIAGDLKKAKAESEFPDIRRPHRDLIIPRTFAEAREWLVQFKEQPKLSIDIEVHNFEVSCIGFAPSPKLAVSIPINGVWEEDEEMILWRLIAEILENPKIIKIMQNGIFEQSFLLNRCKILIRGAAEGTINDTMIKHHIVYPELPKGLEYLVACYCGAQEHYKAMVSFKNIKEEA